MTPNRRTSQGSGCTPCSKARSALQRTGPRAGKSFAKMRPKSSLNWDYERNAPETPETIAFSTETLFWWECHTCGHRWHGSPKSHIDGRGCNPCGRRSQAADRRRPRPGQSFTEKTPLAAAEWDYSMNGGATPDQVRYGSNDLYWFLCATCSNSWQATPHGRSKGDGCRVCSNAKLSALYSTPPAGNSLGDLFPLTSAEWDKVKNGDVTPFDRYPSSNLPAFWVCGAKGHRWESSPNDRTAGATGGCPRCSTSGSSKWERAVSASLCALGLPIDPDYGKISVPNRKRDVAADLVFPAWQLVVELDGSHWHGFPESLEKDLRQTAHLEDAGWTVIRVRAGLASTAPNDLELPGRGPTSAHTTIALVAHLASLGYATPDPDTVRSLDYSRFDENSSTYQLAHAASSPHVSPVTPHHDTKPER